MPSSIVSVATGEVWNHALKEKQVFSHPDRLFWCLYREKPLLFISKATPKINQGLIQPCVRCSLFLNIRRSMLDGRQDWTYDRNDILVNTKQCSQVEERNARHILVCRKPFETSLCAEDEEETTAPTERKSQLDHPDAGIGRVRRVSVDPPPTFHNCFIH